MRPAVVNPNSNNTVPETASLMYLYKNIIENSSDAILTRDSNKHITSWNKGAELLLGYTRDEAIGKTALELGMIRFTATEMKELDDALETKGQWKAEKEYYHRDGTRLYGSVSANALVDENGQNGSTVFIIRDITPLMELEKQLKEQNELLEERVDKKTREVIHNTRFFQAVIENSNDITSLIDTNYRSLYRSPSAERITGWTHAELDKPNAKKDLIHPDDLETFLKNVEIAKATPGLPIDNAYRLLHKNGYYINLKGAITNFLNNEDIRAIVFNSRDITEQVKQEEELNINRNQLIERERLMTLFIEHAPSAIAMFDKNMNYLVASERWCSDYGLQQKDIIGRSHYDVFPEITEEWKVIHRNCLQGIPDKREEDRFERSNGMVNWLRWEIQPWYQASGEIGGVLMFTEDITARKNTENEIAQSEEKYRSLLERVSDGFISLDTRSAFTYVSPVAEIFFNRSAEELIGKLLWDELPNINNSTLGDAILLAMRTQKNVRLNEIPISANRWVKANLYPSSTGLSIFFQDTTENYLAHQAVHQSETYRKKIMGSALDAIICAGYDEKIISCNPQALRLFGWSEEDIIGRSLTETIIPERYRQRHSAGVKHYLATGEGPIMNKLVEVSALNKEGNELPIEMFIVPIEEKNERFFCAFIRDISVRKNAEKGILKTQMRFGQAQEIAHMGNWEIDFTNHSSKWSDEAYRIYGLEPADHNISQEQWLELVHPEDRSYVTKELEKGMENWKGTSFHHRIIRNDGTVRYLYADYRYETDGNGNPTGMYGIVHDITEQKELELQLQEQERKELLHLSAATLRAQEKERNAIGRELHDNVNQILVGSLLVLSMIKKNPKGQRNMPTWPLRTCN